MLSTEHKTLDSLFLGLSPRYQQAFLKHNQHLVDKMADVYKEKRDEGITHMDEDEFWELRHGRRTMEIWREFEWVKPLNSKQVEYEAAQKIGPKETASFVTREEFRRKHGLWVIDPKLPQPETPMQLEQLVDKYGWDKVVHHMMPGGMYFMLAYAKQKLKDDPLGRPDFGSHRRHITLQFRLWEDLYSYNLDVRERSRMHLLLDKSRSVAFTTSMVCWTLNRVLLYPGWECIVMVPLGDRRKQTSEKFIDVLNALPEFVTGPEKKKWEDYWKLSDEERAKVEPLDNSRVCLHSIGLTSKDGGRIMASHRGKDGIETLSYLYFLLPSESAAESYRPNCVIVDEKGLVECSVQAMIRNTLDSMRISGRIQGFMLFGGTADPIVAETAKGENNDYLNNERKSPRSNNWFPWFISFKKTVYDDVNGNGYPDETRALEIWEEELEDYKEKAASNPTNQQAQNDLSLYRTKNPLVHDDCYITSVSREYDIQRVDAQIKVVQDWLEIGKRETDTGRMEDFSLQYGYFRRSLENPDVVQWIQAVNPDDERSWCIYVHPSRECLQHSNLTGLFYAAGTDPADTLKLSAREVRRAGKAKAHSNMCTVILNMQTGLPVAYYLGRHEDALTDYDQMLYGLMYYKAMSCIEVNKRGFVDYLLNNKDQGRYSRHIWRPPANIAARDGLGVTTFGGNAAKNGREYWLKYYLRRFLDEHMHHIYFIPFLQELKGFSFSNAAYSKDTMMALLMASMMYYEHKEYIQDIQRINNGVSNALYNFSKKSSNQLNYGRKKPSWNKGFRY